MSFGSDSPGGSPEGIGGNESGIGGGGYDGGGGSGYGMEFAGLEYGDWRDIATPEVMSAFSDLSIAEKADFIENVAEPQYGMFTGWQGSVAKGLLGFGAKALGNIAAPGLGTLAGLTGLTSRATQSLMDTSFSNSLAESLGISKSYADVSKQAGGENVVSHALKKGIPSNVIEQKYNQLTNQQGGAMGLWEDITGATAAGAATGAAGTQAGYQQQALDYLKQMGAIPLEAQQQLAGVYGLPGGVGDQQQMIEQAQASPLYGAIMGGQQAGEEAIMRQAGATGGLRSGNIQSALADYNTQLQNQALMQSYGQQMGGLTGLAGMGTYAPETAAMTSGIGGTLAGGQTAAAQAGQAGTANLLGIGGALYKEAGGLSGMWDIGKGVVGEVASWF